MQHATKGLIGIRAAGKPDDIGAIGKPSLFVIVIEGRDQFTEGQVAGSAKDDNAGGGAGFGHGMQGFPFPG